jgi:hypothetical protein
MIRRLFMVGFVTLVGFFSLTIASPNKALAVCSGAPNSARDLLTFQTWDSCLPKDSNSRPVIKQLNDVWLIALPILDALVKIAGYMSVGLVIWGSILFVKSQGEPSNITKARDTIRDALIGLVISVSAVTIIQYIASKFTAS